MKKFNRIIIFLIVFCFTFSVQSQTLKGGEVIVDKQSPLGYDFYFVYYFNSENDIDQPFIRVAFGDGVVDTVVLLSQTEPLPGIKKLVYLAPHAYAGNSHYQVNVLDVVQLPELKNLEDAESYFFSPYTSIWTPPDPLYINNKRPAFENTLLSGSFHNGKWVFDNKAIDMEGDSLFYYFINYAELVDNYYSPLYPGYALPLATDTIQINNSTGEILWDKPQLPGNYLIGMTVLEFSEFGHFLGRLDRFLIVDVTEEDIVTGISFDNLKLEAELKLFPNPANQELRVSFSEGNENQAFTLSIFNILGERLFEQRGFDPGGAVDVSDLSSGTYILQLQTGERVMARKFVVQR